MGEVAQLAPVVVPPTRSLVRKLAEVMGEVDRIPKSGRNTFHNYDYATEADIVASVRGGMARRALMLVPDVEKTEWREGPVGKDGKAKRICSITVRFTLEDGDSGEQRVFHVIGEGEGADDKTTYKAMTGATKYALLKLFLIPTGDDPEKDDTSPPKRQAAARQQIWGNQQPASSPPAQSAPPAGSVRAPSQSSAKQVEAPKETRYQHVKRIMSGRGVAEDVWRPVLKEKMAPRTTPAQMTDADVAAVLAAFPEPPEKGGAA